MKKLVVICLVVILLAIVLEVFRPEPAPARSDRLKLSDLTVPSAAGRSEPAQKIWAPQHVQTPQAKSERTKTTGGAYTPRLYGVDISGGNAGPSALVLLNAKTGKSRKVGPIEWQGKNVESVFGLEFTPDGTLFAVNAGAPFPGGPPALFKLSLETATAVRIGYLESKGIFEGFACNATGQLYAINVLNTQNGPSQLYRVDSSTGHAARATKVDAIVEAIAFGPDGTLYAAIEREG